VNFEPIPAPWTDQALCAQTDPEAFFPEKGGSSREAKRVCRACPVRAECLEYALAFDERFGIWGGLSERERRRLKRQRGGMGTLPAPAQARDIAARYVPGRNGRERGNGAELAAEFGITRAQLLRIVSRAQHAPAGTEVAA